MDDSAELFYIILTEHLEFMNSLLVMAGILSCRLRKAILPYVFASGAVTLLLAFMVLNGYGSNLPPLCLILEFILVWSLVRESFLKKTIMYIMAYIFNYVIGTLISSLLSILLDRKESFFWDTYQWRILIILINICIVIAVSFLFRYFRKDGYPWIRNVSFRYLALGIPGLLCCALVVAFVQMSRAEDPVNHLFDKVAVISVTLVCIIYSIGTVLFIWVSDTRKNYQLQNQLKDKYLNIQKSYYKNILENDQELRRFKHDLRAYIGCMRVLAEQQKYEELTRYITEVSSEVDGLVSDRIHCGNDIVDAMLSYMVPIAEKEGFKITLDGMLPPELSVTDMDLCTILSNTITNAIEACREPELKETKTIGITVGTKNDTIYMLVENPVRMAVDLNLLGKGTTKSEKKNHGFGVRNILEAVERNHGHVRFNNTEGKFQVEIILQPSPFTT